MFLEEELFLKRAMSSRVVVDLRTGRGEEDKILLPGASSSLATTLLKPVSVFERQGFFGGKRCTAQATV